MTDCSASDPGLWGAWGRPVRPGCRHTSPGAVGYRVEVVEAGPPVSGRPRTTLLDGRSADLGFRSNFAAYTEAGANRAARAGVWHATSWCGASGGARRGDRTVWAGSRAARPRGGHSRGCRSDDGDPAGSDDHDLPARLIVSRSAHHRVERARPRRAATASVVCVRGCMAGVRVPAVATCCW